MAAQQNLVPNGSFEIFDTCPYNAGQVNFAKGWYLPTTGSSDYFNSCDITGYFSTPTNSFGYQIPFHGNAYVGFITYIPNFDYSEYISVKLNAPLLKDYMYNVSYYLSLLDSSKCAINSIGAYFDKDSVFSNNALSLSLFNPQVVSNNFIINKAGWTKVSADFVANGDEQFMVIGNFKLFSNTSTLLVSPNLWETYYYIDSVSVYKISDEPIEEINLEVPNVFTPNMDGINDVWEFYISNGTYSKCVIYNRWGLQVFETTKQFIKWDGRTTCGEQCIGGVYYYVIQTETENYKGFIQLLR